MKQIDLEQQDQLPENLYTVKGAPTAKDDKLLTATPNFQSNFNSLKSNKHEKKESLKGTADAGDIVDFLNQALKEGEAAPVLSINVDHEEQNMKPTKTRKVTSRKSSTNSRCSSEPVVLKTMKAMRSSLHSSLITNSTKSPKV